ncbi:hypothetical protein RAS1_06690 [Phycisphaerae bacterium RAS1]|nr:hypothetical protein RAS1_06690 [Phycisphaerae bacterium RAS1]
MLLAHEGTELKQAVADAVNLVNAHSGKATIRLRFASDGLSDELDFVANSARLNGDMFTFVSGFETFGGKVAELAGISAEVIKH